MLKPHLKEQWVIPPQANSAFVAAMEDVLAVYKRPRNPDCPLVCLDEAIKQLIKETRVPIPMKKGRANPQTLTLKGTPSDMANLIAADGQIDASKPVLGFVSDWCAREDLNFRPPV